MSDIVTSGVLHDWQTTLLWQELQNKHTSEAESVRTSLKQYLPDIQRILAQGGTSPLDFTLHDSNHSYRVAQLIAQVIPTDVLPFLSSYELALLLLSAYLHDIGMTPERKKVVQHHRYLLTGSKEEMSKEEVGFFQKWLDESANGIIPPITKKGEITPEDLRLADELTT